MEFFTLSNISALTTLAAMEIILGIDNIIFIAILVAKLPKEQQESTRKIGITLALVIRVMLLFSIKWVMGLTEPFFSIMDHAFSGRDLILIGGGFFLIAKSTFEIHHKVEGPEKGAIETEITSGPKKSKRTSMLLQILALDIVFSLDSVITAVGMVENITIMVLAMVIAMVVMLLSAGAISHFVEKHPTIKILALSFLLMIGVMLVVEGMGGHFDKSYMYVAMFFSLAVEFLNIRARSKASK
jgi:predicted tellurium resistance membrane protein TerC